MTRLTPQRLCRALLSTAMLVLAAPAMAGASFKPVETQYIAALADPSATSGSGAEHWGLWTLDPGPRGVRLNNFEALLVAGGVAPAQWTFDKADWWLEENGLIMEAPAFGLAPGKYLVTGNRAKQSVLTIHPKGAGGHQRWDLSDGATLYDVTHLRCRSARYQLSTAGQSCSPASVNGENFPVAPGAAMPPVPNCGKQDYAVVFIIGVEG